MNKQHNTTTATTKTATKTATSLLAVGIAAIGLTVSAGAPAFADSGITTTGDVNLRTGPGTQHDVITVVPAGTSPTYHCWRVGEEVSGVDVWFSVDYNGANGYISSSVDDSTYASDAEITSKYGIAPCVDAAAPAVSGTPTACYGDYCSGQDPAASGCATDAVTIYAIDSDVGGGRLELRWSPKCKTNWARWQQYPTGVCVNCSPLAIRAEQDTGYTQKLVFFEGDGGDGAPAPGTYWTPMIYSPQNPVKAVADMPCGDMTLISAAFDCGTNGSMETEAG